jgi:hypothetical protein
VKPGDCECDRDGDADHYRGEHDPSMLLSGPEPAVEHIRATARSVSGSNGSSENEEQDDD